MPSLTGLARSKNGARPAKPYRKLRQQNNFAGYVFIFPWLLVFLAVTIIPMLLSLYLSFTRYDILSPARWVGLQNFENIFLYDYLFTQSLKVTFRYAFISVPLRLAFALFLAILLVQPRRGVGLYRTLFYVPSVFGQHCRCSDVEAAVWNERSAQLTSYVLGLDETNFGWLTSPQTALWTLIILAVWQFGSPMLIFLAGLKQIPASLYEAAMIDGASGWQSFTRITIPMLTPIIFFNFVVQIISGFMMFTQALVITNGDLNRTLLYILYVFRKGFTDYSMGYASALA